MKVAGYLVFKDKFVYLLGFRLKLSKTEKLIAESIAEYSSLTTDELLQYLPEGVTRGNVAVHISSINRKAYFISERKLILYAKAHYSLNPYM